MLKWAQAKFVQGCKTQTWQELVFVLAGITKVESHEKAKINVHIIVLSW